MPQIYHRRIGNRKHGRNPVLRCQYPGPRAPHDSGRDSSGGRSGPRRRYLCGSSQPTVQFLYRLTKTSRPRRRHTPWCGQILRLICEIWRSPSGEVGHSLATHAPSLPISDGKLPAARLQQPGIGWPGTQKRPPNHPIRLLRYVVHIIVFIH